MVPNLIVSIKEKSKFNPNRYLTIDKTCRLISNPTLFDFAYF